MSTRPRGSEALLTHLVSITHHQQVLHIFNISLQNCDQSLRFIQMGRWWPIDGAVNTMLTMEMGYLLEIRRSLLNNFLKQHDLIHYRVLNNVLNQQVTFILFNVRYRKQNLS